MSPRDIFIIAPFILLCTTGAFSFLSENTWEDLRIKHLHLMRVDICSVILIHAASLRTRKNEESS